MSTNQVGRGRLGLSLAGGGFRASLFHLGVLRRLAELDILRRVEVLSTVSGGSIIGALYVLLLKKYLERQPASNGVVSLTRDQYVELVTELEHILVRGIRRNLRTRLLMNPLGNLLIMLTGDSLGRRMARLYERHLLRDLVADMDVTPPRWWLPGWFWRGQIRMQDLVIRPGGQPITGGLATYNARQRANGGSVVTSIVLNATSLNSGGRFFFSAVELGDWYLGYFRESEFGLLLARKQLHGLNDDALRAIARGAAEPPQPEPVDPQARTGEDRTFEWDPREARDAAALILRMRGAVPRDQPDVWAPLFAVHRSFPGLLGDAAFGLLRRAKLAAWYIRVGSRRDTPVLGARTPDEHIRDLWAAIGTIDPDIESHLRAAVQRDPALLGSLADYILELYWLRSAERISSRVRETWRNIRLGHAIGASACFPPVFPPFLMYGLYDDLHAPRLGLTDGGVFDNMGITALLDDDCTEIIASDTSGLFNITPVSTSGHLGLARRVPDLLMRALGSVQREGLRERRRVSRKLTALIAAEDGVPAALRHEIAEFGAERELDELVYFHISSPRVEPVEPGTVGAGPAPLDSPLDPLEIARLRTDLDAFGDVEIAALVNHGYDMADRYVRRYAPAMAAPDAKPPEPPRPFVGRNAQPARASVILRTGSSRFFRSLKLRSPVSWAFMVAAITGVITFVWRSGITLESLYAAGGGVMQREIDMLNRILGWLPFEPSVSGSTMFLVVVLGAVGMLLLWSASRRPRSGPSSGPGVSLARTFTTVRKWARAFSGNVLWALLGLPAIIAAGTALLATASYVFFHLPFMRATRIRPAPAVVTATAPRPDRGVAAGGG